jgi:hypothetical protein
MTAANSDQVVPGYVRRQNGVPRTMCVVLDGTRIHQSCGQLLRGSNDRLLQVLADHRYDTADGATVPDGQEAPAVRLDTYNASPKVAPGAPSPHCMAVLLHPLVAMVAEEPATM